jgi:uncharacterized membrane protein
MKYFIALVVGIYFGYLLTKAGVEPFSSLYWQFLLAQFLLIVAGGVLCLN